MHDNFCLLITFDVIAIVLAYKQFLSVIKFQKRKVQNSDKNTKKVTVKLYSIGCMH